MIDSELVSGYLHAYPDKKRLLHEKVYAELLLLVQGLQSSQNSRTITTPEYVTAMISAKMLLIDQDASPITNFPITQKPDQNIFDYEIENPFWSEHRVYGYFVEISAIIGKQPVPVIVSFFKYLSQEAINEVKKKKTSSSSES